MSKRELKLSRRELKMSSLVTSKVSFLYLAIKYRNYFINLGCRTVQNNRVLLEHFSRISVAVVFSVVVNARVACSCAVFRSLLGPQSAYRHRYRAARLLGTAVGGGPVVGKLVMGLMALFEPKVLASASFLIDFYRALTFKGESEADFSRFLVELM